MRGPTHTAFLAALLLASAVARAAKDPCQFVGPLPETPDWAQKYDPFQEPNTEATDSYVANLALVEEANASGKRFDVVLIGDSITANSVSKHPAAFEEAFEGLQAAALGVMGNTVEELSWRLMVGGERLEVSPRVVILNIGLNNLQYGRELGRTAERLSFLMGWLEAAYPASQQVLHNLLPSEAADVAPWNEAWERLAVAHGWNFSTCGAELDSSDEEVLHDGVHLTDEAYRMVLPCLRGEAEELLAVAVECEPAGGSDEKSSGATTARAGGNSSSSGGGASGGDGGIRMMQQLSL